MISRASSASVPAFLSAATAQSNLCRLVPEVDSTDLLPLRYYNWALFNVLRSHLSLSNLSTAGPQPPLLNLKPVFDEPTFLIPKLRQRPWETRHNRDERLPWKMPAANPHNVEKPYDPVQQTRTPWDPDRNRKDYATAKSADLEAFLQKDFLKAVLKVPAAEEAKTMLMWKVQLALDRAWHHNARRFDQPMGPGIKFRADPSEKPATGSAVAPHLRRHAVEFLESDFNKALLLTVAVGYTGYIAGMHFNPDVPQWLIPAVPLAIPGTQYRVPGVSLKVNYVNDFRGTMRKPLEPQEFRATIQVDVNELLRLFRAETATPRTDSPRR